VQENFCNAANVAVLIVERRDDLLVGCQVPTGTYATQVPSVAMSDFLPVPTASAATMLTASNTKEDRHSLSLVSFMLILIA
jgi:hypothetical protein